MLLIVLISQSSSENLKTQRSLCFSCFVLPREATLGETHDQVETLSQARAPQLECCGTVTGKVTGLKVLKRLRFFKFKLIKNMCFL